MWKPRPGRKWGVTTAPDLAGGWIWDLPMSPGTTCTGRTRRDLDPQKRSVWKPSVVKSLIRLAIWGGGTGMNPLQRPSWTSLRRLVSPGNSVDHCPFDSPQALTTLRTVVNFPFLSLVSPIYSLRPLSMQIFRGKPVYVFVAMGSRPFYRNREDLQARGDLNRNITCAWSGSFSYMYFF
jgi:hypothetical protein